MGLYLCVYVKAMCKLMNSLGFMFVLWSMAKCEIWWLIGFVRLCLYVVVYGKALNFFDKQAECLWYMVKDVEDKLQSWMLRFSSSQIMDAMGIVYPHYWLQSYNHM
jgi:hypothetical protein